MLVFFLLIYAHKIKPPDGPVLLVYSCTVLVLLLYSTYKLINNCFQLRQRNLLQRNDMRGNFFRKAQSRNTRDFLPRALIILHNFTYHTPWIYLNPAYHRVTLHFFIVSKTPSKIYFRRVVHIILLMLYYTKYFNLPFKKLISQRRRQSKSWKHGNSSIIELQKFIDDHTPKIENTKIHRWSQFKSRKQKNSSMIAILNLENAIFWHWFQYSVESKKQYYNIVGAS